MPHSDIAGGTPWTNRIHHVGRIGVVFGQRTQPWWDLPVLESFALLRDIYQAPKRTYRETRDEMIHLLNLEPLLSIPVRQCSCIKQSGSVSSSCWVDF